MNQQETPEGSQGIPSLLPLASQVGKDSHTQWKLLGSQSQELPTRIFLETLVLTLLHCPSSLFSAPDFLQAVLGTSDCMPLN